MKQHIIVGLLTLSSFSCFGQWAGSTGTTGDIYRTGSVGIGLSSVPLNGNLVVTNPTSGQGTRTIFGGTQLLGAPFSGANTVHEIQATGYSVYSLVSNYNAGSASFDNMWLGTNTGFHGIFCMGTNKATIPFEIWLKDDAIGTNFKNFQILGTGHLNIGRNNALQVYPSGQVSIGLGAAPMGSASTLAVNGLIACNELKVIDPSTPWPDFVFEEGYQRMGLDEVEEYITTNKHLPQLPSAEVISKEGAAVGATQKQILQSLEELYLHVIDLKKENEQLKAQLSKLKK